MPIYTTHHSSKACFILIRPYITVLALGLLFVDCKYNVKVSGDVSDSSTTDTGNPDTGPSDTGIPDTEPPDSDTDAGSCEQRKRAYQEFLAANQSCEQDTDCEVIGDCGPNADFASVRVDAAAQARELQLQRCSGAWDGPMYNPICHKGSCDLEMRQDDCCGCVPDWDDAGF